MSKPYRLKWAICASEVSSMPSSHVYTLRLSDSSRWSTTAMAARSSSRLSGSSAVLLSVRVTLAEHDSLEDVPIQWEYPQQQVQPSSPNQAVFIVEDRCYPANE